MADVFISYSKKEPEITVALASILEANGYTTWWDTSLLPGDDFPDKITEEIQKSKVTIVIWTNNSINSSWVRAEAYMADAQKKLVTVRSSDLNTSLIPLPFNTRHTDIFTDAEKILRAVREQMWRLNLTTSHSGSNESDRFTPAQAAAHPADKINLIATNKPGRISRISAKLRSAIIRPSVRTLARYSLVAVAFAPIAALILGSPYLNNALVSLLTPDLSGPSLNGRYLFPTRSFTTTLVIAYIIFITTCLTPFFFQQSKNNTKIRQVFGLRQDIDDLVRYIDNIKNYMYGINENSLRLNVQNVYARHVIYGNGDTFVESLIEIKCTNTVHFWEHWIDADPESDPITILRDLDFNVTDLESGQKLDWLPIRNESRDKIIIIFFPQAEQGTIKQLLIRYKWPGYMKRLFELGSTSFFWKYTSHDSDIKAKIRKEWAFSADCPADLKCRITGYQSKTATLYMINDADFLVWVYEDFLAPTDSHSYSVEFLCKRKRSFFKAYEAGGS